MNTSSGSNNPHQYTHEYVYHHEITEDEDVSSNNNVPQTYPSSPKCWMKFLQHQMNQVLSKSNHESSSDSNAYHRCIHVDVHHHKVTKDATVNVNNNVLQPCHHKK